MTKMMLGLVALAAGDSRLRVRNAASSRSERCKNLQGIIRCGAGLIVAGKQERNNPEAGRGVEPRMDTNLLFETDKEKRRNQLLAQEKSTFGGNDQVYKYQIPRKHKGPRNAWLGR